MRKGLPRQRPSRTKNVVHFWERRKAVRTELKADEGEAMFRVLVRPLGKSGENDTVCDVRIVRKVKTPQLKQQVGHGLGCGQV